MLGFFLVVLLLLALAGGLYWRWRRQVAEEIAEGAAIEWAHFQKNEPEFLKGMSEEKFREIYARVHAPRFPGYALATFATFLISLPATLALLSLALYAGEKMGLVPQPVEMVRYVNLDSVKETTQPWQCAADCQLYIAQAFGGFYYFFGVIAVWLVIVWFFMRRYHRRRPGYLRDEIIRSRE